MSTKKQKVVWLDINSSYSHSSLALPAIQSQRQNHENIEWGKVSGTINSVISTIIEELLEANPDIIAYTAWLFTHETVLQILSRYKRLNPDVIIIGGGPEYLGNNHDFLLSHPYIDFVVRGEGEELFYKWIDGATDIKGLCFIKDGIYHDTGIAKVENYTQLQYPEDSEFFDWDKPFIQIESTRGCFNSCAFCVSGADKPVRSLPIDQLRQRLLRAQARGIKDIRLLDRTFNGVGTRAIDMLSLFEEFAGVMQFHIEVHPALFTAPIRAKISKLPKGLLHIEAGVQSLSQKVLDATSRFGQVEDVLDGLQFLCSLDNLEIHSDLIAGLPHYTLSMIYDDVRTLSSMGCAEIQLELLKLLPGTAMRKNSEIIYSPLPPYEVMHTNSISYSELQEARRLSRAIDIYYNCTVWQKTTRELIAADSDFMCKITAHLTSIDMIDKPMSQERRGIVLYEYCKEHYPSYLLNITVDWIMGGLSLKKGAGAGAKSYIDESAPRNHRLYYIEVGNKIIKFAYDRSVSHSEPISITIE